MHIGLNQNLNQAISFKVINWSLRCHEMILIKNDHSDFQRHKMAFGNSLSAEQKLNGIYLTLNNKKKKHLKFSVCKWVVIFYKQN